MTLLQDITFLRPLWLLALPGLAAFGWWLWSRQGGLGDWEKVSDPALMRAMARLGRIDKAVNRLPLILIGAVAGLCVLALAGPAVERRDTQSYRNLDGVLLLVDASSSVTGHADWPRMQAMGRFALASLGTRPGGIIVFGGDAYMATDMTLDHLQLGQTFSLIDADTVPDRGSRPGRALDMALTRLVAAQIIAGDVILFTDGDGLGPETLKTADQIAAQGARLSVVSPAPAPPAAATHAQIGGGRVFTLDQSEDLGRWLAEDQRARLERQDFPLLYRRDLGRFILLLAVLPLALMFRRQAA